MDDESETVVDFDGDGDGAGRSAPVQLVLDLDGFEGPIDVLLALARDQKVDLAKISILQLAEQFLEYVRRARRARLELAADYLVMAAWLAYLKSRLLLPPEDTGDDEPSAEEMAEALAFQLRRLEAMRDAAARLMARHQLGRDMFARGLPDEFEVVERPVYATTLNHLLMAYADQARRKVAHTSFHIRASGLMPLDEAVRRLSAMIGQALDWTTLASFLPRDLLEPLMVRSALASTFVAALELCREGRLDIQQATPFGPLFIRQAHKETAS